MNNIIFYTLPIKIFMLKIKFNIILSCLPDKTMPRDPLLRLKEMPGNVMPFCKGLDKDFLDGVETCQQDSYFKPVVGFEWCFSEDKFVCVYHLSAWHSRTPLGQLAAHQTQILSA